MPSSRRSPRDLTENEKEHEYVMHNKRSYGDKIQGDLAEELDEKGGHGEVKQRREAYSAQHPQAETERDEGA